MSAPGIIHSDNITTEDVDHLSLEKVVSIYELTEDLIDEVEGNTHYLFIRKIYWKLAYHEVIDFICYFVPKESVSFTVDATNYLLIENGEVESIYAIVKENRKNIIKMLLSKDTTVKDMAYTIIKNEVTCGAW